MGDAKAQVAQVFSAVAPAYDQSGVPFFGTFARRLVELLGVQPGWHALDVGSGRGAVVFPLVEAVGPTGRVTAVDLAPGMVEALRADVDSAGIRTVDARVGDLDHLELPDASVDVATASMVLFFLPDPISGLRALHRVLRPGGRLGFTVFAESDPDWQAVYDAFLPHLPEGDRDEDLSRPRHPAVASAADLHAAAARAGFADVDVRTDRHEIVFADPEQWRAWSWSCGLRGVWLSIPEPAREAAARDVLDAVRALTGRDGGLVEHFAVHYLTARRP